jgi:NO-binding membrane sensor protein with MHYT domain
LGHISLTYQIEIVTLSILIAIFGAFTSFELLIHFKSALKRLVVWLISSSSIMGISVWAMLLSAGVLFNQFPIMMR